MTVEESIVKGFQLYNLKAVTLNHKNADDDGGTTDCVQPYYLIITYSCLNHSSGLETFEHS